MKNLLNKKSQNILISVMLFNGMEPHDVLLFTNDRLPVTFFTRVMSVVNNEEDYTEEIEFINNNLGQEFKDYNDLIEFLWKEQ